MLCNAVIRNLEIMGEAAKNVPIHVQNRFPALPWKRMYMLRNFLAHEYLGIDLHLVWRISKHQLDELLIEIDEVIATVGR